MQSMEATQDRKTTLKLKSFGITKLVGDLPENFEALKSAVKATMTGEHEKLGQLLESDQYSINFFDSERNTKRICNDDDLRDAYSNVATRRILKIFIDPLPESPLYADWNLDSKTNQKSKGQGQETIGGYDWRQHVKPLTEEQKKIKAEKAELKAQEKAQKKQLRDEKRLAKKGEMTYEKLQKKEAKAEERQFKKAIKKELMDKCMEIYDESKGTAVPQDTIQQAAQEIIKKTAEGEFPVKAAKKTKVNESQMSEKFNI